MKHCDWALVEISMYTKLFLYSVLYGQNFNNNITTKNLHVQNFSNNIITKNLHEQNFNNIIMKNLYELKIQ